jgi:hypothetical protein
MIIKCQGGPFTTRRPITMRLLFSAEAEEFDVSAMLSS